jgi:hypothetical protein
MLRDIHSVLVCGLLAMLAAGSAADAAVLTYTARLSGAAVTPAVTTGGSGTAAVQADTATREVSWRVDFTGLSSRVVGADIRCTAVVGVRAAGIAVQLGRPPHLQSPIIGSGRLMNAQLAALEDGRCSVNLATAAHPAGEIGGRLKRAE